MAAGVAIGKNHTVQDAVLPAASTMAEWAIHLYRWHHEYLKKMKGDLESLGCTAVVQNSFTLTQRCHHRSQQCNAHHIAGCGCVRMKMNWSAQQPQFSQARSLDFFRGGYPTGKSVRFVHAWRVPGLSQQLSWGLSRLAPVRHSRAVLPRQLSRPIIIVNQC